MLVKAKLHRSLVGNVDLDGEEQKGGFDKCFVMSLPKNTENERVAYEKLVSSRFLFDFLNLALKLLDFRYFTFNGTVYLISFDALVFLRDLFKLLGSSI